MLVDGPAITDLVTAHIATTGSDPTPSIETGTTPTFYGRSPATIWQLDLRGPMAQGLQLDNLQEVRLGITILGVPTPPAPPSPVAPVDFGPPITVNLSSRFLIQ
jgi:hypothetical protein